MSTLRFGQRAKFITNEPVINEITEDHVNDLSDKIRQLKVPSLVCWNLYAYSCCSVIKLKLKKLCIFLAAGRTDKSKIGCL